ncbi:hypothetical protein [Streptomyces sp. NPDC047841]|uniref:hypothetical protein n=1 Tax=Streptomyces sp. NPDC047841 TaxID=3154708 RepID=UPI0034513016
MDSSVLKHPRIAEAVETLVIARGGRITYDVGGGGRETLLAAGARLAAETDTPLTIVEARSLHSDVRAFVREVQPEARSAVISAEEAALPRTVPAGRRTRPALPDQGGRRIRPTTPRHHRPRPLRG